jgi:hypothetical protein
MTTFTEAARLAVDLFHDVPPEVIHAAGGVSAVPQGESLRGCTVTEYARFREALDSPQLTSSERSLLSSVAKTSFQHQKLSSRGHYRLRWDSTGSLAVSQAIVDEAATDLEQAHDRYVAAFGVPPSSAEVEVLFDNARTPQTVLPGGPISLPASYMKGIAGNRLDRTVTAAHELFHVLQGRYRYRTAASEWFLEGSATLAEMIFYASVSSGTKLTYFAEHPLERLRSLRYGSVSFFVFLENFFAGVKTGPWFIRDVFEAHTPGADPLEDLDVVARRLMPAYTADRLLAQFALQFALGTWYRTASGAPAIPAPKDCAQNPPRQMDYAIIKLKLPTTSTTVITDSTVVALSQPFSLKMTGFFFFRVSARTARPSLPYSGVFARAPKSPTWVGAAVINAATGAPAPGHAQVPFDASAGPHTFNAVGEAEVTIFVAVGNSMSSVMGNLTTGP